MLGNADVFANVAVKDLSAGKKFYGQTLGLKQTNENPGGVTYQSGSGKMFMYQSPTAGSGQATCATWEVSDVEAIAKELKNKGVAFEHYDMPGGTREGDVHVMGSMKAAWFKDPDGNILCVADAH